MWAAYVDPPSAYLALMGALAMILPFILVLALATVLDFRLAPGRYRGLPADGARLRASWP